MRNMDKGGYQKAHAEFVDDGEQVNPFGLEPFSSDEPDETSEAPSDIVILPRIVKHITDDAELDAILLDENEDEDDQHQHYFTDQIHFDRYQWSKPWFGAVSMIAFAVDLSNMISFPTNLSKYGGVSYLIIYTIVVLLFAYPMLYLEVIVGQYFQTGMIGIWGICPIGRGLGMGVFYLLFIVVSILPMNTLWAIIMGMTSLQSMKTGILPWMNCDNEWNSCNCSATTNERCKELLNSNPNYTIEDFNSPSLEYFLGNVLKMWKTQYNDPLIITDITQNGNWSIAYGFNNDHDGLGPLVPRSCFILVGIFSFIMLMCMAKPKYIGFFYTFSTVVPIMILALLFCRTLTLEGALKGLKKYLRTDLSKLFDLSAWESALATAFFSISCGCGIHMAMISFNPLNHNAKRDAIICVFVDTMTSILSSVVSYMFIGHLYYMRRESLPETFPGENVIFIALAESFTSISGSSFFAALFYFMIFLITIDTQLVSLHAMAYSLYEEYRRKYPEQNVSQTQFIFCVWGLAFSITLLCATRGGYWFFSFFRNYMFGLSATINALVESILLAWVFGISEICIATETVLGYRPSITMRIIWKYFVPILTSLLLYKRASREILPVTIFGHVGPAITANIGFKLQWVGITIVVVYAFYVLLKTARGQKKTCLQLLMLVISPEYEHAKIMENVKNAKRLKWQHYTFIKYDDEGPSFPLVNQILKTCKNAAVMLGKLRRKKEANKPEQKSSKTKSKKAKKQKKKEKKDPEQELEDNLWTKLEKEGAGVATSEKAESTSGKKKSKKKKGKVATQTSPKPMRNSKVNPIDTG